jgi:hypothetical protein
MEAESVWRIMRLLTPNPMAHINPHKNRHLRSSQKTNQLLLQYRNENGDISPGLEAALRIIGPIQTSRPVSLFSLNNSTKALLLYGAKCSVLFAPGMRLELLVTHARQLSADWAINWDTGIKTRQAATLALVGKFRDRSGNRVV